MNAENWIDLSCHPAARPEIVRAIRARMHRSDTTLRICYCLEGNIGLIRVPPPRDQGMGHELWRHTCFEAFVKIEGQGAYHELNFAPSSVWAVYWFSSYRNGAALTDESICPQLAVRSTATHVELDAVIQLDRLSALHPHAVLILGLAAVIETSNGFSYWALHHPADTPDFHNAEGFVLRLEPPTQGGSSEE